jgi:hypothetical protein
VLLLQLREFQHNRDNIPTIDNKHTEKNKGLTITPASSPVAIKNGMEPKPPDPVRKKFVITSDVTNNNDPSATSNTDQHTDIEMEAPNIPFKPSLPTEDYTTSPRQAQEQLNFNENIVTSTPVQAEQEIKKKAMELSGLELVQSTSESLFQLARQMNGLIGTLTLLFMI